MGKNALAYLNGTWTARAVRIAIPLALVVVVAAVVSAGAILRSADAAVGDSIPFVGLEADQEGSAAWNASGTGPEPAKTGHPTSWTTCLLVAYYYLASRDYSDIDPTSVAGLYGLSPFVPAGSFPLLASALADNGLDGSDLMMSFGLQTLGGDQEGQNWTYDGATRIETRYYTGGEFTLKLQVQDGQPPEDMVGGAMPRTTLTLEYNELNAPPLENCLDDQISGVTDAGIPGNRSAGSSPKTQAVAAAFIADLAGDGIRFFFDSLQPIGQEQFTGNGRTGAFFEAQVGRIEVAAAPASEEYTSCIIGIFEADVTHNWKLEWTAGSLPTGDPVRLRIVASSVNAAESGAIGVSITDNSGPMSVEVVHPATGDAEDYLELDITPGLEYPFNVQITGNAQHYALGASHEDLSISQTVLRYLEGVTQHWSIMAAAEETVTLLITPESDNLGANQATTLEVTVVDEATGAIVFGPETRSLSEDVTEEITFANGSTARKLVVMLDHVDGYFYMTKFGGDTDFYVLPCPAQEEPVPTPVPSLGAWGMIATAGALALAYIWSRRRWAAAAKTAD